MAVTDAAFQDAIRGGDLNGLLIVMCDECNHQDQNSLEAMS